MGASANSFDANCAPRLDGTTSGFCDRVRFGISIGVIGTAFSLGVVGMKVATSQAPFLLEMIFAILLLVLNGFGIAILTSVGGPGAGLSNLYYFTWISGICSFMCAASCVQDYRAMMSGEKQEADHSAGSPTDNDIPVEPLDKPVDDV